MAAYSAARGGRCGRGWTARAEWISTLIRCNSRSTKDFELPPETLRREVPGMSLAGLGENKDSFAMKALTQAAMLSASGFSKNMPVWPAPVRDHGFARAAAAEGQHRRALGLRFEGTMPKSSSAAKISAREAAMRRRISASLTEPVKVTFGPAMARKLAASGPLPATRKLLLWHQFEGFDNGARVLVTDEAPGHEEVTGLRLTGRCGASNPRAGGSPPLRGRRPCEFAARHRRNWQR